MEGWRDCLLRDFDDPIAPLSLVSDPDGFLHDSKITKVLKEKSIDVLEYGDPVAFRYVYELKYRERLINNQARLIVRVKGSLDSLPYDLLQLGRQLKYDFANIFPKLSTAVVRELEPIEVDLLYSHYPSYTGSSSLADSCDFILQKIYRIPYHLIDTEKELIRALLSMHYAKKNLPPVVQEHLITALERKAQLKGCPIRDWVSSETAFYRYIQEEWPIFLAEKEKERLEIQEKRSQYVEPSSHPFDDPDIRGLLGTLFVEGKISKVDGFNVERLPLWTHVGLVVNEDKAIEERFTALLEKIEAFWLDDLDHRQIKQLAALTGETKSLWLSSGSFLEDRFLERWTNLNQEIDSNFQTWLEERFGSLLSLPYVPWPVMVHHIPHYLSWAHTNKTALIVLDGMNFSQWVQIRTHLQSLGDYIIEEDAVFAWIPTITPVSRQAIFSGEPPFAFSESIRTTNKEEQAWKLFWENEGIYQNYISYQRALGDGTYQASQALPESIKVAGYVIDTIDKLVHRALQGQNGVRVGIELWLENNYLHDLIQDLLDKGFSVYLTSDHGNCESTGIGRLHEGALAQTKGERVRVYDDRNMRDRFLADYQGIAWDGHGLPTNMFLLLAQAGHAFTTKGNLVVSHGGISLEEVVVPFAHIKQVDKG